MMKNQQEDFPEGRQEQLSEIQEEETETELHIMGAGLMSGSMHKKKNENSQTKLIKKQSVKSPPKHNFK